jgi:DNA polymerase III alpha subunit
MFIHLTTHSAFSLQEGLGTPAELVQAAQANGMTALGLTDHNLLTGMIEFVSASKAANLQPIIGLEINLNDGPLTLLATSLEGWSCLCRLSKQPQQLKEIFPGHLYVNLQDPDEAQFLSKVADQLALPTVVTHPVYYLTPEQAGLQRTLTAVRLGKTVTTLPKDAPAPSGAFFLTAQQMQDRFHEYPEAVAATVEIAERCKFDLPISGSQMPTVPLPIGLTAAEYLRQKATQGAKILYGEILLIDFSTLKILATLTDRHDMVEHLIFSPDGQYLISASTDGTIRTWGLP